MYIYRSFLKEKRETTTELLEKKREIFLSKMNINIKKDETKTLRDKIINCEESLNAEEAVF